MSEDTLRQIVWLTDEQRAILAAALVLAADNGEADEHCAGIAAQLHHAERLHRTGHPLIRMFVKALRLPASSAPAALSDADFHLIARHIPEGQSMVFHAPELAPRDATAVWLAMTEDWDTPTPPTRRRRRR